MKAQMASPETIRPGRTLALLAGATTLASVLAGTIAVTAAGTFIRLLNVSTQGQAVVIEATEPVAYTIDRPDPLTLVVDLRNAIIGDATTRVESQSPVSGIRLEQTTAADGRGVARVRIALTRASEYRIRSTRNAIRVELTGPAVPAAAVPRADQTGAAAPTPAAMRPAASRPIADAPATDDPIANLTPTSIERVRTIRKGASTMVTISGNGKLVPAGISESKDLPRRLILDFPNVSSRAAAQTQGDGQLVHRVRIALNNTAPLVTRVVMEIAKAATYDVRRSSPTDRELTVVFNGPAVAGTAGSSARGREDTAFAVLGGEMITLAQAMANGAALAAPQPLAQVEAMAALKARPQEAAPPQPAAAAPQPPAAPAPVAPPATSPVLQGPQGHQISGGETKKYVGHPISMDFQGVDLRSVLRTFAEISGLNMVIDPEVQGTVDIVLTDVPWDQALEVILRGNSLDYTVDGTIVRIAKLDTLRREQDARTQLAQSAANAGALAVRTYALSYAKADQAAPLVKSSVLSPRGNVQIDTRTNTLIITDLPARLDTVSQLLGTLDRAEPQVEIEARIITTTRDYARALGVQWGFNGRVNSAVGNTTNLAFPNNGALGGRVGGVTGNASSGSDVRAGANDDVGTGVGLAVPSATSAIGLALGAINGAFNLDVALSALERSGKGRILSTPRITTQNNVEAEITQGVQIPVQTEANNTVTVTFKDAALTLKVTPQITASNTVIMQITLENASPGTPVGPNLIPSIDTQRAITRVQVNDGMTTVMGGIFVSREQVTNDRTPVLHRIPFLSWLFKRDDQTDSSRELLIFITPRIQKG